MVSISLKIEIGSNPLILNNDILIFLFILFWPIIKSNKYLILGIYEIYELLSKLKTI